MVRANLSVRSCLLWPRKCAVLTKAGQFVRRYPRVVLRGKAILLQHTPVSTEKNKCIFYCAGLDVRQSLHERARYQSSPPTLSFYFAHLPVPEMLDDLRNRKRTIGGLQNAKDQFVKRNIVCFGFHGTPPFYANCATARIKSECANTYYKKRKGRYVCDTRTAPWNTVFAPRSRRSQGLARTHRRRGV